MTTHPLSLNLVITYGTKFRHFSSFNTNNVISLLVKMLLEKLLFSIFERSNRPRLYSIDEFRSENKNFKSGRHSKQNAFHFVKRGSLIELIFMKHKHHSHIFDRLCSLNWMAILDSHIFHQRDPEKAHLWPNRRRLVHEASNLADAFGLKSICNIKINWHTENL